MVEFRQRRDGGGPPAANRDWVRLGGSTRLPAAYSGLVGIHPTAGLVPSVNYANPAPYNPTITIGPLARDVRDCATALQAMAGPDWRDFDCIEDDPPDFLEHLDEGAAGLRLAWTDDYGFASLYAFEESPRAIAAVRAAAMGLKSLGAEISTTDLVWEDFFPGYMTTNYVFGSPLGPMPRPERAQWVARWKRASATGEPSARCSPNTTCC